MREAKRTTRRTPINGVRNVLTVQGKDPDFEYRIVNDEGDRVAQFESMGYEVVTDQNVKVGDRRIANPTKEGSPVQVSVGGGVKGYVMRIKKDWYAEDQASKQSRVNETEEAMKKDARKNADYGKLDISQS
jgi:hypothetical protein